MACITGVGKGSLSVESCVDKKAVEMVRLGAVLQVAGQMVVPRSVFESDREGVRDNLERELSALSARSFESVWAGMEKELDRTQCGRLCFRIVGGDASAQEADMECADLSKEEIDRVDCARGILEKEACRAVGVQIGS
jgi:hypothetical protein